MTGRKNRLVSGVVILEACVFLLPTTIFYLAGMLFSILGFFTANKGGVTPAFLVVACILTVPGYGLFSLWWLVAKHRRISEQRIPKFIWGGVIVGVLTALLFLLPFLVSGFTSPMPFISISDDRVVMLLFGGGPLLLVFTLLAIMRPWRARRVQL